MHPPTVRGIAEKFAPPPSGGEAVTTGCKPTFRPLAESAATASLEEQIGALKEISSLLREQLEETRNDRDAWRTQAEGRHRPFGRRVKGFLGAMTGVLVTILTVFVFDALNTSHSQRIVNWDVAAARLSSSAEAIRDALTR
jgi:hypothetical protein